MPPGASAMILTTKHLILRPIRLGEAPLYFEDASDPEVCFAAGLPPQTMTSMRERVRKAAADWEGLGARRLAFSIYLKPPRVWIGGINIRWPHGGVGELGYAIRPAFWGKGYATEAVRRVTALAFLEFAAHRVQANCRVENPGSAMSSATASRAPTFSAVKARLSEPGISQGLCLF